MGKDDIIKVLKDNGYKNTSQRNEIIESIISENRYVTAKQILIKVQNKFPNISLDTIYRNLSTLSNLGLIDINYKDGEAKYKLMCINEHHHHMICEYCGEISVIKKCPMDFLEDIGGDFQITDHKFEIYGICKKCRTNKKRY